MNKVHVLRFKLDNRLQEQLHVYWKQPPLVADKGNRNTNFFFMHVLLREGEGIPSRP
jgi:hypothetical protein